MQSSAPWILGNPFLDWVCISVNFARVVYGQGGQNKVETRKHSSTRIQPTCLPYMFRWLPLGVDTVGLGLGTHPFWFTHPLIYLPHRILTPSPLVYSPQDSLPHSPNPFPLWFIHHHPSWTEQPTDACENITFS